jgi:hydroxymethylpyrimidine pyrophosphatase-like HAD family hydrolase
MTLSGHFKKLGTPGNENVCGGVYCDVYGTLVNSSFEGNTPLVEYLNALHESGVKVTIFSTDHFGMRKKTQNIGLHPELAGIVRNKANFANMTLETLIDDDPPRYLNAKTLWNPKAPDLYAHIDSEMKRLKPTTPPPPAP